MRNRFFTEYAGVPTTLLTFDSQPVYPLERQRFIDRGELVPGMRLLNIFEFYRDSAVPYGPPHAEVLPELEDLEPVDVQHPDGTVYYTAWRRPEVEFDIVRDYRRPDGSIYLRGPGPGVRKYRTHHILADREGRPVESWGRIVGWYHHWLRTLAGTDERVYVFSEGRSLLRHLLPMPDDRFRVMHVLHNVHTVRPFRWNSALAWTYGPILDAIPNLDGLVSLTQRQRDDVRQRCGPTNNLFAVPNPVTIPRVPDPLPPRNATQFSIVTRIDGQKRLDHAIRAFALVSAERPEARLSIYGRGTAHDAIQGLIDRLEVSGNIKLCGWDPDARDNLWTSSGFLMSSAYEGYPLATLESLSRGCPVISYDIKYGPREQITDGVDGFLVEDGDQRALADRIIRLIDNPELVGQMSAAALAKARAHDFRSFMADWHQVLTTVEANRAKRVKLNAARLKIHTLGHLPISPPALLSPSILPVRHGAAAFRRNRRILFDASLKVTGAFPRGALTRARITLDAVSDRSAVVTRLPLTVERSKRTFRLGARSESSDSSPTGPLTIQP